MENETVILDNYLALRVFKYIKKLPINRVSFIVLNQAGSL
jgi:hypothetical protein